MRIGVPKETAAGERRVALVPDLVTKLTGSGIAVVVEPGAGEAASFTDDAFREAGAELGDPWGADVVAKVRKPNDEELAKLRNGQVLIGFLQPLTDQEGIERSSAAGVTAFAMESIPRITRAQPMDALSSQATVVRLQGGHAGCRAAAEVLADADDCRRHRHPGEGARDRRGRGRAAGDRDGAAARRRRLGLRRPAGREGAGREPRRDASSSSASSARRPRAATRGSSPRRSSAASRRSSRRGSATSTWSSRPRSSRAAPRRS